MEAWDLLVGFVSGAVASAAAAVVLERAVRPKLEIRIAPGRAQGHITGNPPHEFFHVWVHNISACRLRAGRKPAWSSQAHLAVVSSDGGATLVGPIPARWASQPEPVVAVGTAQGVIQILDVARMLSGRKVDIHTHESQALVVAVKFENDPDIYLFTNESYARPDWSNPDWKLTGSRHRIRVTVDYERGREQRDFWIHNRGLRRDDVSFEAVT